MENFYSFAAIRGVQAGRTFYVAMIKLKVLGRLFPAPREAGVGRRRIAKRAGAIAELLAEPSSGYLLAPLAITVAGDMRFDPNGTDCPSIGRLSVDIATTLSLVDGEQRVAGICRAMTSRPFLGEETIGAVMLAEEDRAHSARLFRDLNGFRVQAPAKTRSERRARDLDPQARGVGDTRAWSSK